MSTPRIKQETVTQNDDASMEASRTGAELEAVFLQVLSSYRGRHKSFANYMSEVGENVDAFAHECTQAGYQFYPQQRAQEPRLKKPDGTFVEKPKCSSTSDALLAPRSGEELERVYTNALRGSREWHKKFSDYFAEYMDEDAESFRKECEKRNYQFYLPGDGSQKAQLIRPDGTLVGEDFPSVVRKSGNTCIFKVNPYIAKPIKRVHESVLSFDAENIAQPELLDVDQSGCDFTFFIEPMPSNNQHRPSIFNQAPKAASVLNTRTETTAKPSVQAPVQQQVSQPMPMQTQTSVLLNSVLTGALEQHTHDTPTYSFIADALAAGYRRN